MIRHLAKTAKVSFLIGLGLTVIGCEPEIKKTPRTQLADKLKDCKEYDVNLINMREDPKFQHKYKIICAKLKPGVQETTRAAKFTDLDFKSEETDWVEISPSVFKEDRYLKNLGMTILSKDQNGKVSDVAQPPGYRHMNREGAGSFVNGQYTPSSSGISFFEMYGMMSMASDIGGALGSISRSDWDDYDRSRRRGYTYYGSRRGGGGSPRYGTRGTYTKRTRPNYYRRVESKRRTNPNYRFGNRAKTVSYKSSSPKTTRSNLSGFRSRSSSYGGK